MEISCKDEMLSEYDFSKGVRGKYARRYAIGFDIGGTKIEAAVISQEGLVTHTVRHQTPPMAIDMAKLILMLTQELQNKKPDVCGVGFSIPGSLEPKTGVLRNAPNSPSINQTDFFPKLISQIKLPYKVENDANCLMLSEARFGAAKGYSNAIGIIMGTGFGSGVWLDGKLFVGQRRLAPELGHTVLDVNGRLCLCGNQGCAEAYLSGPSILKRYHEAAGCICRTTEEIFVVEDPIAKMIVQETLHLFDRFMAMLVSVYDPEIIILGGGLSRQKIYYGREEKIARHVFGSTEMVKIKPAAHGDASGKLGAATLFF